MFNSTHTFVGLVIARTGADKWVRYAGVTAVIASNLPDIDSLAGLWGTATYLDHHRGITHSLLGIPLLAAILSIVMCFFSENFGRTFAVATIAMATHPALDYLNSYGLRPFLPWKGTWYYSDTLFIFDPYLDLVLLAGIVWGQLQPARRQRAALISMVVALAYIGAQVQLHTMTGAKVEAFAAQTPGAAKWAVLPQGFGLWQGMVETATGDLKFPVSALRSASPAETATQIDRSPSSDIIAQASTARSASALLRFARFPVIRVAPLQSGWRVTFLDFRFYRERANTALAAEVILDPALRVTRESASFVQKIE